MTIRRLMASKKRRIISIAMIGFASILVCVVLAEVGIMDNEMLSFAVLPGVAIFTFTMFYAYYFAFQCPQCGVNWSSLAMQPPPAAGLRCLLALDNRIRFCPFCGSDIDAELNTERIRVDG